MYYLSNNENSYVYMSSVAQVDYRGAAAPKNKMKNSHFGFIELKQTPWRVRKFRIWPKRRKVGKSQTDMQTGEPETS